MAVHPHLHSATMTPTGIPSGCAAREAWATVVAVLDCGPLKCAT
jgi:hypothetical protein